MPQRLTNNPPPASHYSARALRDALRRLLVTHAALNPARRPCGTPLKTSHAWTLLLLRDAGPLTVTALAEHLNITRANVSRLCSRMESAGEVVRVAHPEDRRARLVGLSEKGERLAETVNLASAAHFTAILARLEAEASGVIDTLDTLTQAMAAAEADRREDDP